MLLRKYPLFRYLEELIGNEGFHLRNYGEMRRIENRPSQAGDLSKLLRGSTPFFQNVRK